MKSAAQRLAEHMLKVGADKWVSLPGVLKELGIDKSTGGFALHEARELLRVEHGRTIKRENNSLMLTLDPEATRAHELDKMFDASQKAADRCREHLAQVVPHARDDAERQRFTDSAVVAGRLSQMITKEQERARRKRMIFGN